MTDAPQGPPPMPRWVKITGVVFLVVIVVAIVLALTTEHGPQMHSP